MSKQNGTSLRRFWIIGGIAMVGIAGWVGSAQAGVVDPPVVIYEREKGTGKVREKVIETRDLAATLGLVNPARFETEHFQVYLGPQNPPKEGEGIVEAILPTTGIPDDLRDRAASVLYHLEFARSYFVNVLKYGPEIERLPRKTKVLLDMKYNRGEFERFNFVDPPEYNNAVTVPADRSDARRWDAEIWFRPSQRKLPNQFERLASRKAVRQEVALIRNLLGRIQLETGLRTAAMGLFTGQGSMAVRSLITSARSLLFAEILYAGFQGFNRFYEKKEFFNIPELIPEVVYHEYVHFAFQKTLIPGYAVAASEGIANYFAAEMIGFPRIAGKMKAAFRGTPTKGDANITYHPQLDLQEGARNDLSFTFLWQLRNDPRDWERPGVGPTLVTQGLLNLMRPKPDGTSKFNIFNLQLFPGLVADLGDSILDIVMQVDPAYRGSIGLSYENAKTRMELVERQIEADIQETPDRRW